MPVRRFTILILLWRESKQKKKCRFLYGLLFYMILDKVRFSLGVLLKQDVMKHVKVKSKAIPATGREGP
jgi:hypothetical protein